MGVTSSRPSLADTFSPDQAASSLLIALPLLVWKLVWERLLRAGQTEYPGSEGSLEQNMQEGA